MDRPSREKLLMAHAELVAMRSTCSRAAVGVVIAREGRILVTGYNGAPAGMTHCDHECDCGQPNAVPVARIPIGHTENCKTLLPCTIAIHAEANAVGYAARWGAGVSHATLYTTFCPCLACAQLIITAGIDKVVFKNEYRDRSGLLLLEDAGLDIMLW